MRRPLFDRPILHRDRNRIGDRRIQRGPLADRLLELFVNRLGKAFALRFFIKDVRRKKVLHRRGLKVDARGHRLEAGEGGNRRAACIGRTHDRVAPEKKQKPPKIRREVSPGQKNQ